MPGPLVTLPQAGDEITATWGQSVAGSLNGIQVGTATVPYAASGTVGTAQVVFPRPFVAAPIVVMSGQSGVLIVGPSAITPTGFQANCSRRDGNAGTGSTVAQWVAIGTLA